MAGVVVDRECQGCSSGVCIVWQLSGINWFFADISCYIKYIPRSTAYYFEPQIKNLMILMSLCWELLMGWRTSQLGLKFLRACRRILLCHPIARSLSNWQNKVPKLGNFAHKIGTHNSFLLIPVTTEVVQTGWNPSHIQTRSFRPKIRTVFDDE